MSGEAIEIRWQDGTTQQGTVVSENTVHGYADIAVEDGVVRVLRSSEVGEGWVTPARFNYFRES
jgi:hypothetical protein